MHWPSTVVQNAFGYMFLSQGVFRAPLLLLEERKWDFSTTEPKSNFLQQVWLEACKGDNSTSSTLVNFRNLFQLWTVFSQEPHLRCTFSEFAFTPANKFELSEQSVKAPWFSIHQEGPDLRIEYERGTDVDSLNA